MSFNWSPFIPVSELEKTQDLQCSIIDPGRMFRETNPQTGEPLPEDQEQAPAVDDDIVDELQTLNFNQTILYQYVVDTSNLAAVRLDNTTSRARFTQDLHTTLNNLRSVRLVYALIPNPNQKRYCIIEVNDYFGTTVTGNGPAFNSVFHVMVTSVSPTDTYFNYIPFHMPYTFPGNSSVLSLDIAIKDPDGNDFDTVNLEGGGLVDQDKRDILLIFEFDTAT